MSHEQSVENAASDRHASPNALYICSDDYGTKLTDKANHKWIWDHNTYCTDSGDRLHNYRVIKQQPRPETQKRCY